MPGRDSPLSFRAKILLSRTGAAGKLCSKSGLSSPMGKSWPSTVTNFTWGSTLTLYFSRIAFSGCPRNASVLGPAVSRALKDHLVLNLIHVEQLFTANNDSKRFDQSDELGLPSQPSNGRVSRVIPLAKSWILRTNRFFLSVI